MTPVSALRSVARQCLAAAALFGFTLNVATPTVMHGCAHPAAAGAEASEGMHAHHGHRSAPADKSPHGKTCQCVGQSCGTALAMPAPATIGLRAVPGFTRSEFLSRPDHLPVVAQHRLPFAVGPPSSIPA